MNKEKHDEDDRSKNVSGLEEFVVAVSISASAVSSRAWKTDSERYEKAYRIQGRDIKVRYACAMIVGTPVQ
jgi:hypothetical protein